MIEFLCWRWTLDRESIGGGMVFVLGLESEWFERTVKEILGGGGGGGGGGGKD
jgi:hypothetical protein